MFDGILDEDMNQKYSRVMYNEKIVADNIVEGIHSPEALLFFDKYNINSDEHAHIIDAMFATFYDGLQLDRSGDESMMASWTNHMHIMTLRNPDDWTISERYKVGIYCMNNISTSTNKADLIMKYLRYKYLELFECCDICIRHEGTIHEISAYANFYGALYNLHCALHY